MGHMGRTMKSNPRAETPERLKAARACQRMIGRELRTMYDDITREPVPDEFLDLLHKADEAPRRSDSA
jgi:anti-sigma factor NepR-like protein